MKGTPEINYQRGDIYTMKFVIRDARLSLFEGNALNVSCEKEGNALNVSCEKERNAAFTVSDRLAATIAARNRCKCIVL